MKESKGTTETTEMTEMIGIEIFHPFDLSWIPQLYNICRKKISSVKLTKNLFDTQETLIDRIQTAMFKGYDQMNI